MVVKCLYMFYTDLETAICTHCSYKNWETLNVVNNV
jgi:hypothetical protein